MFILHSSHTHKHTYNFLHFLSADFGYKSIEAQIYIGFEMFDTEMARGLQHFELCDSSDNIFWNTIYVLLRFSSLGLFNFSIAIASCDLVVG